MDVARVVFVAAAAVMSLIFNHNTADAACENLIKRAKIEIDKCNRACNHCKRKGYIQERACLKQCRKTDQPIACGPKIEYIVRRDLCLLNQNMRIIKQEFDNQMADIKNKLSNPAKIRNAMAKIGVYCNRHKDQYQSSCSGSPSSACKRYRQGCINKRFQSQLRAKYAQSQRGGVSRDVRISLSGNDKRFGPGKSWRTPSGHLFVFQGDRNVVLYTPQQRPLWATACMHRRPDSLALQGDGNVVLYAQGRPVWATNTDRRARGGSFAIQNDGNLVVYDRSGRPLWASGTNGDREGDRNAGGTWGGC